MAATRVAHQARRATKSMNGDKRTRIGVNATPEEKMLLEMRASNAGISVSKLLLDSALRNESQQAVSPQDIAELRHELYVYRRQLVGMATNLNQLAKLGNATQEFSQDVAPLTARISQLVSDVSTLTRSIKDR